MTANEDQIHFWNELGGREWVTLQETMDRNLSGIHAAIMGFAAPTPGMRVLDVGCGTGTTSMALADAVGSQGAVTGIDISVPMLELAKSRGAGRGNLSYCEADASAQQFHSDHDLLFSRFGVMFFDNPVPAFANLRMALKPGGRMAFVCWRTPGENLWASAPMAAAKPFLPQTPPPDPLAPGPFAFADPARVTDILGQSGFSNIRIEKYDGVMNMGRDLALASAQTLRIGPLSRAAADVDSAAKDKIVDAVQGALATFTAPDGSIVPPVACWLVSANT